MQPQALTRAAHREIRETLGDSSLGGERLAEAIDELGPRHGLEPFRACLRAIAPIDRPEDEARRTILAIDDHREKLGQKLRRDPGFGIAAIDYLQQIEGVLPGPVRLFTASEAIGSNERGGWPASTFDDLLTREIERGERSGTCLALIVVRPDRPPAGDEEAFTAAASVLRNGVRDVDHPARILPAGFAVVMPCTAGESGAIAGGRLRRSLAAATGVSWSAGVASCPEQPWNSAKLARAAFQALDQGRRSGGESMLLHRQERRAHRRRPVTLPRLAAALRVGARETEIVVENLSMGGALLATTAPMTPGQRVTLSLRETTARARQAAVPARVVRALEEPSGAGKSPWRAGVAFVPDESTRIRVAGMIADLAPVPRVPERQR